MTQQPTSRHRTKSVGEHVADSISHGIGLLAAIVVTPILIVTAAKHGGAVEVVGVSIFAATMIALYLASTVYHALSNHRAKPILETFDRAAIFLLIGGTYTPFTLAVLPGAWGWTLFGLVWGLALIGIVVEVIDGVRHRILLISLYVAMGWLVLIAIRPLWLSVPAWGFIWLLVGGIAYTGGVAFYAAKHRYSHFVWHLFVLAGTTCHFIAVLLYAT